MGVQIDILIPPVIVGMLVVLIFSLYSFLLETSADTRLQNNMQTHADVAVLVIQEELRNLDHIVQFTDSAIQFVTLATDTVKIHRKDRNLEIIRVDHLTLEAHTATYPSGLSALNFTLEPNEAITPTFLRVKTETESLAEEHVRFRKEKEQVKAFAEKQIFLRNLALSL